MHRQRVYGLRLPGRSSTQRVPLEQNAQVYRNDSLHLHRDEMHTGRNSKSPDNKCCTIINVSADDCSSLGCSHYFPTF